MKTSQSKLPSWLRRLSFIWKRTFLTSSIVSLLLDSWLHLSLRSILTVSTKNRNVDAATLCEWSSHTCSQHLYVCQRKVCFDCHTSLQRRHAILQALVIMSGSSDSLTEEVCDGSSHRRIFRCYFTKRTAGHHGVAAVRRKYSFKIVLDNRSL